MVELALVLPLLLLLVMGIIFFGLAYNAKVELTGAVREGARALALGQTPAQAKAAVQAAAPAGGTTITFPTAPTTCVPGVAGSASITASMDMDYTIPFFSSGTWTIESTGVMRCGL